MSAEQLADIFFGTIQEEALENTEEPWAFNEGDLPLGDKWIRFLCTRIGNTLLIKDSRDGNEYTLTLEEKVNP